MILHISSERFGVDMLWIRLIVRVHLSRNCVCGVLKLPKMEHTICVQLGSALSFRRDRARSFSGCDLVQQPNLSTLNYFLDPPHRLVAIK